MPHQTWTSFVRQFRRECVRANEIRLEGEIDMTEILLEMLKSYGIKKIVGKNTIHKYLLCSQR